jgi:hypothetical protein
MTSKASAAPSRPHQHLLGASGAYQTRCTLAIAPSFSCRHRRQVRAGRSRLARAVCCMQACKQPPAGESASISCTQPSLC